MLAISDMQLTRALISGCSHGQLLLFSCICIANDDKAYVLVCRNLEFVHRKKDTKLILRSIGQDPKSHKTPQLTMHNSF